MHWEDCALHILGGGHCALWEDTLPWEDCASSEEDCTLHSWRGTLHLREDFLFGGELLCILGKQFFAFREHYYRPVDYCSFQARGLSLFSGRRIVSCSGRRTVASLG